MMLKKYTPVAASLCSLVLLTGCAAAPAGEAPAPAPGPSAGHTRLGSFVMRVRPKQRRVDVVRLPDALAGEAALHPENLDNLPIVSDGVTGSGPADSVELDTDQSSIVDTYGTAASGTCPANGFCADVTFMHFYPGVDMSAVYTQITAVTDSSGTLVTGHGASNGVSSTPFGLDLTYGAWSYTGALATIAPSTGVKRSWDFYNPDDADTNIYLDAWGAVYPMVWFSATTGVTQTAPLVAGQPAIVHYEYARNTACRGSGWSMQGFLKGDNIDIHTTSWTGVSGATYFDQQVVMPFGPGLDFWFDNTDGTGCTAYDSNGGSNYNYGISDANTRIHFAGPSASGSPYSSTNWQVYADSSVQAGATFTVDYELDRVLCGSLDQYGRVPSGTAVTMYYSFDGGAFTPQSLLGLPYDVPSSINGSAGQVFVPPYVTIPSTSHALAIYFDSTGSGSCHNYDSNFSVNYNFTY